MLQCNKIKSKLVQEKGKTLEYTHGAEHFSTTSCLLGSFRNLVSGILLKLGSTELFFVWQTVGFRHTRGREAVSYNPLFYCYTHAMPAPSSPIGIFDSGIGGLSVLQALRREMPHEHLVYLADSANAPYGERGDAYVGTRSGTIVQWLRQHHHIKALVIACNTATAAAVEALRYEHPDLPIIGVEPALKPAALSSHTRKIGVIATQGTVNSARFAQLQRRYGEDVQFVVRACNGLAQAIEDSISPTITPAHGNTTIESLCRKYLDTMGTFGTQPGQIDTLVLGCTHYVFAAEILRNIIGPAVQLLETGIPVACRTRELLGKAHNLAPAISAPQHVELHTTGDVAALIQAARTWLQLPASVCTLASIPDGLRVIG